MKRKESRNGIEPRSFRLPAYSLTARLNRLSACGENNITKTYRTARGENNITKTNRTARGENNITKTYRTARGENNLQLA